MILAADGLNVELGVNIGKGVGPQRRATTGSAHAAGFACCSLCGWNHSGADFLQVRGVAEAHALLHVVRDRTLIVFGKGRRAA